MINADKHITYVDFIGLTAKVIIKNRGSTEVMVVLKRETKFLDGDLNTKPINRVCFTRFMNLDEESKFGGTIALRLNQTLQFCNRHHLWMVPILCVYRHRIQYIMIFYCQQAY